jgi:hypothetical protein
MPGPALITDAVKQPTAANKQLPVLPLGPLSQHQLWSEQEQYHFADQRQYLFHFVTAPQCIRHTYL